MQQQLANAQERIQELEVETAIHLEALDTAKVWHSKQKKEITEQKDQQIAQLETELANMRKQQAQIGAPENTQESPNEEILANTSDTINQTEIIANASDAIAQIGTPPNYR